MNIQKLTELLASTRPDPTRKGHVFTVAFFKKDGTLRTMKARLGMRRNLKGRGLAYNAQSKGLLPVWEAGNGYRMINLETVERVSIRNPVTHRREGWGVRGDMAIRTNNPEGRLIGYA